MDDMKKLIERYKKELMEMSKTSSSSASEARSERTEKPRVPQVIGYVDEGAQLDNILSSLTENKPREPEQTEQTEQNEQTDFPDDIFNSAEESADDMPEETEENKLAEPIYEDDSEKTDGYPARDGIDENDEITDNPRFSEPNFTDIPSFEQTRADITDESVPENNEPAPAAEGATNNSATSPRSDFAAPGTVSVERAETLNRQPISGTEYGEQLTGRSFPDDSTPENSREDIVREGSQTEPRNYPEPVYDTLGDFEERNTGRGTMAFRIYTAREALPVVGAEVVISKIIGGKPYVFETATTDLSGKTAPFTLPAPEKSLSLDSDNKIQPFSLYNATISKKGFAAVKITGIPIFDGVNSVQCTAMVPAEGDLTEDITEVRENAER